MRLALLGDAHGDLAALARQAARAAAAGAAAALQVGDLGFAPGLLGPGCPLPRLPIPVLALCGNHEDHAFLRRARADGLAARWAERGLVYQPRGSHLRLDGCPCLFLGGALHADRPQEGPGGNRIGPEDLATALAAGAIAPPDLVASHSCPAGIGIGLRGSEALALSASRHIAQAGHDGGPADDCGEPALAELWRRLPRQPRLWVFGHFHRPWRRQIEGTCFLALPDLAQDAPPPLWDTASRDFVCSAAH